MIAHERTLAARMTTSCEVVRISMGFFAAAAALPPLYQSLPQWDQRCGCVGMLVVLSLGASFDRSRCGGGRNAGALATAAILRRR